MSGYKLGISTTVDYNVDIFRLLELFARHGFDFVSVGGNLEHCHFNDDGLFGKVISRSGELNLTIDSIHAPFGPTDDIAAFDRQVRDESCDRFIAFAERASEFKIPIVILHPHYYFDDAKEACLERSRDSLEKIIERLPKGISLAIENLPRESGSWICSQLLDTFDAGRVGFCYDSSHENFSGRPFHLLEKYYDRLTACHLSDNHGESDEHLVPEDGIIDWAKLRTYFDLNDKMNSVLFEVGTGAKLDEPVEGFIARAYKVASLIFD